MSEYQHTEDREMFKAICSDCGKECQVPFKPTEGKPVRCQDCFRKSRPARDNFNSRDNNRRSSFGNNRNNSFDRNDRRPREMHKTTCSDCGKECEVPFKPSGDKPVYCRECYANHRD